MESVDLWQLVLFVTLFIVPGTVLFGAFGAFTSLETPDEKRWLVRSLIASLCYYAVIFAGVGPWIFTQNARRWVDAHPGWLSSLIALGAFLALPALLGAALGWLWRWLEGVLPFTPRVLAPTAWAAMLSSPKLRGQGILARVLLEDGSTVVGLWSGDSRAGEHSSRDLYFDVQYVEREPGLYEKIPASAGLWIEGSRIRMISFINSTEPQSHEDADQTAVTPRIDPSSPGIDHNSAGA